MLMTKANLETELAPLLGNMLPILAMDENERTQSLDGPSRNNLLKSVLVQIITAFVESTAVVFIFDDAQWLDASTLEVLVQISTFCPKLTLEVVIAKIGSDLQISNDGNLEMAVAGASAKDMLSDLSAAVLFQFDRLNPTFQQILKAASILGQYFVLTDVLDILRLDWSDDQALELIRESDTYSFLLLPKPELKAEKTDHLLVGDSFIDDMPDVPAKVGSICLAFRHIGIMNAIYDSLAYEERIKMNAFVAGVLEVLLSDENEDTLLPSIEYHYSRTGETKKIIHYREMLG
ncbi:hypothetical protein HK101_007925 [Irineochytrium annulatum]|nr:hypothetical protein HK101_007925 [Irineochytrium annulatum]